MGRSFVWRGLGLATALAALPWPLPARSQEPAAHLIVVSLDTTRADHFGFLGASPTRTPRLDALADESIVFTDFTSVAPGTLTSHASLFTGLYPHRHGVPRNGFAVDDANELLAERLQARGFETRGFVGAFALGRRFRIAQGFDHYDQDFCHGEEEPCPNERSAEAVTDAVLRHLDAEGVPERMFLFVHYFDPHRPYTAPPPFDALYDPPGRKGLSPIGLMRRKQSTGSKHWRLEGRRHELQYASEISYMDHHVARLLDALRERGVLDRSVLLVTSDHGEDLLERTASFSHGLLLYQGSMRAVWLTRLPGARGAGSRIDDPVGSVDVLPTVLPLLGLPVPENVDGASIPLTGDAIPELGPRYGQATQPHRVEEGHAWPNAAKSRFVRDGRFKLIQTPFLDREELYDLVDDPGETRNLLETAGPEEQARARRLRALLDAWAESADPLPVHRPASLEIDTLLRLEALGYVEED